MKTKNRILLGVLLTLIASAVLLLTILPGFVTVHFAAWKQVSAALITVCLVSASLLTGAARFLGVNGSVRSSKRDTENNPSYENTSSGYTSRPVRYDFYSYDINHKR